MSLNHGKQSAGDFAARVRKNQRKLKDSANRTSAIALTPYKPACWR